MASLLGKVTSGRIKRPHFITIYGADGVGKTKFACDSGKAISIGTEESADRYGGFQVPKARTYTDFMDTLQDLHAQKGAGYETLMIDAVDGVEKLCEEHVAKLNEVTTPEEIPYGKGAPLVVDAFTKFVKLCERIKDDFKLNVIFIGHSHVKAMNDPTQTASYDRHQLKLREKNAAYLREICEAVLFATFETYVKTAKDGDKKGRGIGGENRIMYTERRAAYDAKNRDGLPHKLELSWTAFMEAMNRPGADVAAGIIAEATRLIEEFRKTDAATADIMATTLKAAGTNVETLRLILNRIQTRMGDA